MSNLLRQVKNIVYKLKRQYGTPAVLAQVETTGTDYATGEVSREYTTLAIARAILLPDSESLLTIYSGPFYQAGREFTYGAAFEEGQRYCIIDAKDLRGIEITISDYLTVNTYRYGIKKIVAVAEGYAFMLLLNRLEPSDHPNTPLAGAGGGA